MFFKNTTASFKCKLLKSKGHLIFFYKDINNNLVRFYGYNFHEQNLREILYYIYISRLLLAYLHLYVEKHVYIFCSNIPF